MLVACGGGGGGGSAVPPTVPNGGSTPTPVPTLGPTSAPSVTSYAPATATFTVSVPIRATSALLRQAKFVSPNSQSVVFTVKSVNGAAVTAVPVSADLVSTNPNCVASGSTLNCTTNLNVPLLTNVTTAQNAIITVATYSQTGGAGSLLGSSDVGVTLYANAQNRVTLTVSGIVAGFYLLLSTAKATAGTALTTNLAVVPTDASGAVITGSGAFSTPIVLQSNNAHVNLIKNGGAPAQSVSVTSFNDTIQVQYDGDTTVPFGQITGTATGVTGNATVNLAIARTALSLSAASGTKYVAANGVTFDAPSETTSLVINGGLPPYTVTSGSATIATGAVNGTALAVNSVAFGATSLTVTDAANAQTSVIVAVSAPTLSPPSNFTSPGGNYNATSGQYTFTAPGQTDTLTITGGQPPFTTTSSNASVISATQTAQTLASDQRAKRAYSTTFTLSSKGYGVGILTIQDSGTNRFQIPVVVTATPLTATGSGTGFDAKANAFTYTGLGATGTITPAAGNPGTSGYSCASSQNAIATVASATTTTACTFTVIGYGSSVITVSDANGSTVPFLVTASPSTFSFTTSSTNYVSATKTFAFQGALGQTASFTLSGATTPYSVPSPASSPAGVIAVATPAPSASPVYTITTTAYGQALVTATAQNGSSFAIPVSVVPSSLSVAPIQNTSATYTASSKTFTFSTTGNGGTASLLLSGGATPYSCAAASSVATATINGSNCTIAPNAYGTTVVTVGDSSGQTANFNVQIVAATFGLGSATVPVTASTISFFGLGSPVSQSFYGGVLPYTVTVANPSIATASIGISGTTGPTVTITPKGYGLTQVTLADASGQKVVIPLNVSPTQLVASTGAPYTAYFNGGFLFPSIPTGGIPLNITGGVAPYNLVVPSTITAVAGTPAPALSAARKPATTPANSRAPRVVATSAPVTSANGQFILTIPNVAANYAQNSMTITDSAAPANTLIVPFSVQAQPLTANATSNYSSTGNVIKFTALNQTSTLSGFGGYAPYTFSTSSSAVATVSTSGTATNATVTAVGYGTTNVTVTDSRGNTATIAVNVAPATALSFSTTSTAYSGTNSAFTYTGTTGGATFTLAGGTGTYTVSSSNTSVAAASCSGGSCSITLGGSTGVANITYGDGVSSGNVFVVVNPSTTATKLSLSSTGGSTGVSYAGTGTNLFLLSSIPSGATATFQVTGGTAPYTASYQSLFIGSVTGTSAGRRPRIVGTTPPGSTSAANGSFSVAIQNNNGVVTPFSMVITDAKGYATVVAFATSYGALGATVTSTGVAPSSAATSNPTQVYYAPATPAPYTFTFALTGSGGGGFTASSTNSAFASVSPTSSTSATSFTVSTSGYGSAVVSVKDTVTASTIAIPIVIAPPIGVSFTSLSYASSSGTNLTLGAPTYASPAPSLGYGSATVVPSGGKPPYQAGFTASCPALTITGTNGTSFAIAENPSVVAAAGFTGASCGISFNDSAGFTQFVSVAVNAPLTLSTPTPSPSTTPYAQLSYSSTFQGYTVAVSGGTKPYTASGPLSVPAPFASGSAQVYSTVKTATATTPTYGTETFTDTLGETVGINALVYPFGLKITNYDGTTTTAVPTGGGNNYVYAVYPAPSGSVNPSLTGTGSTFAAYSAGVRNIPTLGGSCDSTTANAMQVLSATPSLTSTFGSQAFGVFTSVIGLGPTVNASIGCNVIVGDNFGTTYIVNAETLSLVTPVFPAAGAAGTGGSVDLVDTTGRTIDFGGANQTATFLFSGNIGFMCAIAPIGSVVTVATNGTPIGTCTTGTPAGNSGFQVTANSAGLSAYKFVDQTTGANITVNFGVTTLGLNVSSVKGGRAQRP